MPEFVDVHGARIEKSFFEANLAEARKLAWQEAAVGAILDHEHCLVCWTAISAESSPAFAFRSPGGWLCAACHAAFLGADDHG